MEDIFRIGVITSTHGLKGEVKVYPTTDDINRFKMLKDCFIRTPDGDVKVCMNTCKFFKNMVILSFKEYDNINAVEKYKGFGLYVTRDCAIPLEDNEYYIADAIGMQVYTESDRLLGVLFDVMQTGANDVFVIHMTDGGELLVPVIPDCVLDMNFTDNRVTVRLMKGMLD